MKSFIVCGYGIPDDIRKDQNYRTYLHVVFNRIFVLAKNEPARIILGGGHSACTPPYDRTEAAAMGDYFGELMHRDFVEDATKSWEILLEEQSLSSLENFLFAKKLLEERGEGEVVVFCEATRLKKDITIANRIFGEGKVRVESIDFDISKNRYLPDEVIEKKEEKAREHLLWALQSEENLQKHHAFLEEKIRRLRAWQEEGMSHVDAVTRWYKEGTELFEKMKNEEIV